jgi:mono/diheme cytochrome c family protein
VTARVTTRAYSLVFWAAWLAGLSGAASGHDVITTKITFDREIIRIVYARCAICHRDGGSAFSLTSYSEARPWAKAIQEEVLERRMPPWGAVKGFGEFRDDQALTPEQIELIGDWVEGGSPEGEPKDLPEAPKWTVPPPPPHGSAKLAVSGEYKLRQPFDLAGIRPSKLDAGAVFQMTAELPDGSIQPLLWLEPYKPAFGHPFWLREPRTLPAGTIIHGLPSGAVVDLLPAR